MLVGNTQADKQYTQNLRRNGVKFGNLHVFLRLLITADKQAVHSLDGINEPECMRGSLIARGVPSEAIMLDVKGFRTILSVIRANQVYGLKSFTIISQRFHNERALYQAEHLGLDVKDLQAFNARSPFSEMAVMIYVREYFARVKMFWDLWTSDETSDTHK